MKRGMILLALLAILTGCSVHATLTPTPTPQMIDQLDPMINGWPTSQPNPLAGTYWNLTTLNSQALIPGTRIILSFSDKNLNGGTGDTIYGNAGCNDYNGPFYISGHQIRLGIPQKYLVGCQRTNWTIEQNNEWLTQEGTYYNTMVKTMADRIADYQIIIKGNRTLLEVLNATGQPVLIYEKIDPDLYQYLSANLLLLTPSPTSDATGVPISRPGVTPSPAATVTPTIDLTATKTQYATSLLCPYSGAKSPQQLSAHNWIAYIKDNRVWIWDINTQKSRSLTLPDWAQHPIPSPDGRRILNYDLAPVAYGEGSPPYYSISYVNVDVGWWQTIQLPERINYFRFSPDGNQVAILTARNLLLIDARSGSIRYSIPLTLVD